MVYHLDAHRRLGAFDVLTGDEVWALGVTEKFEAEYPDWGYAESVLIDGRKLICYPGGAKGYMVALDKKTGEVIWANTDIGQPPSYSSPILVAERGIRQIVMVGHAVIGVDANTGKLLWQHEHINRFKSYVPSTATVVSST